MRGRSFCKVSFGFHEYAPPLLDSVRDSLGVALVQGRYTGSTTASALLVVHAGIVPVVAVHANNDWDNATSPSRALAFGILASKCSHDVCPVRFLDTFVSILMVELERERWFQDGVNVCV